MSPFGSCNPRLTFKQPLFLLSETIQPSHGFNQSHRCHRANSTRILSLSSTAQTLAHLHQFQPRVHHLQALLHPTPPATPPASSLQTQSLRTPRTALCSIAKLRQEHPLPLVYPESHIPFDHSLNLRPPSPKY
ncbi:hypothetical protein M0R45_013653 [Rubus argutus]|uniref:Uncharacterized protein n=1 Tax=Rubus argutus TaxID=59490 RepID=A0AAW1XJ30_RUBAR